MKPKSEYVRYNALKSAYYIPYGMLMPCLRHCPLREQCYIYDTLYQDPAMYYIGRCPIECAQYLRMHQYFENAPEYGRIDQALLEEYIMLQIALERIRKQICLNPEIITEDKQLAKPYELLARLQRRLLKTSEEILKSTTEDWLIMMASNSGQERRK